MSPTIVSPLPPQERKSPGGRSGITCVSTVGTWANFTSPVALLERWPYQLYCSKGVLNTSFCLSELIPLADGSPISLENWWQAPKVSLHNVARDPTMVERCFHLL